MLMLIKIQSWLRKPEVWRFVCFFSSLVALLCYALSSSFNYLFGNWTWWKLLVYVVLSFNVCLALLFAKAGERSASPLLGARMAFIVLMMTSVYSFFFDKEAKGKADAYSLVSSAAFAIMSLGLEKLSHFGFEVDLLYFFCGILTLQLLKIKYWLVLVGGCFSYSLIILRNTLDAPTRTGLHEIQGRDHVVIELGLHSQSQGTRASPSAIHSSQHSQTQETSASRSATQVDSPHDLDLSSENEDVRFVVTQSQQGNIDSDDNNNIVAQFMGCIEKLRKESENIKDTISKHVNKYLKAVKNVDRDSVVLLSLKWKLYRDDNLVVDSLPLGIINDLHESARLLVIAGLKEACLHVYNTCRKEFLREILSRIGLKELNMEEEIDKVTKMRYWIKALFVADRILLPNEARLFERIFEGSIQLEDEYPVIVLPRIDVLKPRRNIGIRPSFRGIDASKLKRSLGIWGDLLNLTYGLKEDTIVPGGKLHQITLDMLDYSKLLCGDWDALFTLDKDGMFTFDGHIAGIPNLLDSKLEAIFKNYEDPTLGYVFIINNRGFIKHSAKRNHLDHIFNLDWLQENKRKFEQNLELYQSSSWNKILDILKLDINESESNVAAELMKDKLHSFNEHFDELCNTQAARIACNEEVRTEIIKSMEKKLLPAYGNFVGRLHDFLGNQGYKYDEYGMFDVQDRLNNLFLVSK